MYLAELLIGLATVILGLALSNISSSLHRLVLIGRKVRWAPEPVLLTALMIIILVSVWMSYWAIRDAQSINQGRALITVAQLMTLYFAAASCLPEPDRIPEEGIDLEVFYYDTRKLAYGAMAVSLALVVLRSHVGGARYSLQEWVFDAALPISLYLLLCFVRARWVHLSILILVIAVFGYQVASTTHR